MYSGLRCSFKEIWGTKFKLGHKPDTIEKMYTTYNVENQSLPMFAEYSNLVQFLAFCVYCLHKI